MSTIWLHALLHTKFLNWIQGNILHDRDFTGNYKQELSYSPVKGGHAWMEKTKDKVLTHVNRVANKKSFMDINQY